MTSGNTSVYFPKLTNYISIMPTSYKSQENIVTIHKQLRNSAYSSKQTCAD